MPYTHAAIELDITEVDPWGKTFRETPLKVSFRLRGNTWQAVQGTYGRTDELIEQTWQALAAALKGMDIQAALNEDEKTIRRRQAQAEMDCFTPWTGRTTSLWKGLRGNHVGKATFSWKRYSAATRAAKLDPTWGWPAKMRVEWGNRYRRLYQFIKDNQLAVPHPELPENELRNAERIYRDRFANWTQVRRRYYDLKEGLPWKQQSQMSGAQVAVAYKTLAERVLTSTLGSPEYLEGLWIRQCYQTLRGAGVDAAWCDAWRQKAFERAYLRPAVTWPPNQPASEKPAIPYWAMKQRPSLPYQVFEEEIKDAIERGDTQGARTIMADYLSSVPPGLSTNPTTTQLVEKLLGRQRRHQMLLWSSGRLVPGWKRQVYSLPWPEEEEATLKPFTVPAFTPAFAPGGNPGVVLVLNVLDGRQYFIIGPTHIAGAGARAK